MAVVHCLGTGLVGAWVAKRLATLGHEVHAYDLQPHRVMGIDGITVHTGDVLDNLMAMSRIGQFDIVLNMEIIEHVDDVNFFIKKIFAPVPSAT